jgi:hypothetical protein
MPKDFDYVTLFQPPYCFKKFALLFSAELKMPHHLSHRGLGGTGSVKPLLQVFHHLSLNSSALPCGVSDENSDSSEHLLCF